MAVDTRNRRAACLSFDGLPGRVGPNPDGGFDQADRQHLAGKYPGILASGAPPAPTAVSYIPTFRPRRR